MALGKHNFGRLHWLAGRIAAELGSAGCAGVVAYVPKGGFPRRGHMPSSPARFRFPVPRMLSSPFLAGARAA